MVSIPEEDDRPEAFPFEPRIGWARSGEELDAQTIWMGQRRAEARRVIEVIDSQPAKLPKRETRAEQAARQFVESQRYASGSPTSAVDGSYAPEGPRPVSESTFRRERGIKKSTEGRPDRPSNGYWGRRERHVRDKAARLGVDYATAEAMTKRREPRDASKAAKRRRQRA